MMNTLVGGVTLGCLLLISITHIHGEYRDLEAGYRLPQRAGYLIVAPRKVRPDQVYRVDVTVYQMYSPKIVVRASLSRDNDQYAFQERVFTEASTKNIEIQSNSQRGAGDTQRLELKVPRIELPGKHKLVVEGLLNEGGSNTIFRNETELEFVSKYLSLFIQTDKPLYAAGQRVRFRIIGVSPDSLKPVFGSLTVYILDSKRNVVRRWLQQQLNLGKYEAEFDLSYPLQTGTWTVQVDAFGHIYEENFEVEFFYQRRFEVNVTVPQQITEKEWGLAGTLYGQRIVLSNDEFPGYSAVVPGRGNVTIKLRMKDADGSFLPGEIETKVSSVTNALPFTFPMEDLEEEFGDVADKEVHIKAWFHDWEWDETQNGTARTRIVRDGVRLRTIGRKLRTFKPDIPFTVYFAVEELDGTPYAGTYRRQVVLQHVHEGGITSSDPEKKLIIPDDNVIKYVITPKPGDRRISVRCWHDSEQGAEEIVLYRYYSPKGVYIGLTTSSDNPEVGNYMVFTVRTSVLVDHINYVIIARGNILLSNQIRMKSQQKTFGVAVSRAMAPSAKLMVYFVYDGEVVSDGLSFYVKDTRLYQASVEVNTGKDFSGDTVELIGRGPPGSYMAFSSVDYSLFQRGFHQFIDAEKITEDLASYDEGSQGPYKHIWHHNDERWDETHFFTAPTGGMDTLQTFELAGLFIMGDMNFTGQSFEDQIACNSTLGFARCPEGQCYLKNKTCDLEFDCTDGYDEIACPVEEQYLPKRRPPDIKFMHHQGRYFNSHSWLWRSIYIMPVGRSEMTVEVPETMDPYVISALVIHPEEGLSIVEKKNYAMYDTSRTFFMTMEMPVTSKRGEQIGVRCALFNRQEERIETIVTLHGHEDYRFVNVEENGFVKSYTPRTTKGDIQTMVILEPFEYRYIHFPVLPVIETGEVTVVITAYTFFDADRDERTIEVKMDGVENGDYTPYLIDLVNQGSIIIPDFEVVIPEQFYHPEVRYHLYVPGSQAAEVALFGDVVTPGFFEDHLSTDIIIGVPHDSAEGYMFDFAINLQTLSYLQATNALTFDTLNKALEYMKDLLMRQYAYMGDDGSFKMFRRESKPCVWVTSFICKSLHAAMMSEWNEELYIEVELINKIALWIANQQDESGAFIETAGVIYDRNMDPITVDRDGNEQEWNIALTAYVTIALSSLQRVSGAAKTEADAAKARAASYLASKLYELDDPFQTASIAYALHVADHNDKDNALLRLYGMRKYVGDGIYWSHVDMPANPTEVVNTVHIMFPRPDFTNLGNAVTATSYALLLYLQKNQEPWTSDSIGIMKWLNTQRMAMTTWSSTQDSFICIQALTAFALGETNRFIYRMEVTIESTFNPGFRVTNTLNASNFDTLFVDEIPIAHGQIKAYAKGTGYAMIQLDAFQNVEYPFLQANPDYESYHVEIVDAQYSGRNASIIDLNLCVKFTRPDITTKTGMTIVQYEVPTGYVVSRDTIEAMYLAGIQGLRRIRFRDGFLITFFEYILEQNTCFTTRLERWYPAANVSIQYIINAFEYAETGCQNNTLYTAFTLNHLHICQACGSFQCPYCPNYNSASYRTLHTFFILALAALAIMVPKLQSGNRQAHQCIS